ncbi:MAG: threonine synthase, partial [Pseudomonadota bacterium]
MTGQHYPAGELHGLSEAGRPLLVRYDLEAMGAELDRDTLTRQPDCNGFWRYRDLLPLRDSANIVTLGEVMTPLIELGGGRLGLPAGEGKLWVKDEGRLPTGSFKARGLAVAIAMARELGVTRVAIPTNGNAGAALAAYASRAGMQSTVFCPDDTPAINVQEIALQGADTWLVNGLINDCGRIVGEGKEPVGWFDISTLKEPYRIEGKKTMGLELAEQLDWTLPDVIFYPTGGGTGLIGMWKAFAELKAMGWLSGELPRMVAVQSTGCAPIVKAWEAGEEHAPVWEGAETVAAGIRVPVAVGDFLIIRAVNESGGFAMAVDDD